MGRGMGGREGGEERGEGRGRERGNGKGGEAKGKGKGGTPQGLVESKYAYVPENILLQKSTAKNYNCYYAVTYNIQRCGHVDKWQNEK